MSTFLNGINLQGIGKRNGSAFVAGAIAFTQPSATALTGYVSPNLEALDLAHKAEIDRVPNQQGNTSGIIATDDYIECTFDYFLQGTTDAAARLSGTLPEVLSKAAITGLPIVQAGPFLDAFNTDGVNTQPWVYEGEGTIGGRRKEKWDGKITLRRYPNIPTDATYSTV